MAQTACDPGRRFSMGEAAQQLGLPDWKLRRLFTSGALSEPGRVGPFRALTSDDIEAARALLAARAGQEKPHA
jgi:hypothetical protein